MKRITIIHPSRGRASRCFQTTKHFLDNSTTMIRYIVSIDDNDSEINEYFKLFHNTPVILDINKNKSAIEAVNKTAQKYIEKLCFKNI